MPINKEHKFAFIHIPKTGGVTIEKIFDLPIDGGHKGYKYYDKTYPEYERHAIVRNPYDRYISAYFFLVNYDIKYPHKSRYQYLTKLGIEGLIADIVKNNIDQLSLTLKPQSSFVTNDEGEIKCNIHRFEEYYNTYVEFCKILKQEPELSLPVYNKGIHKDYKTYYKGNDKFRDTVYEYYKEDFKLFNYNEAI